LVDKYIVPGKVKGMYSESTIAVLKKRSEIMNPLMEGKKVVDLFMIDTLAAKEVLKMGFDTARSAESITALYYKNQTKLSPLFKTLYQIDAKYTLVVFWAADCGHCQKEIPKLNESLKALKGKIDFKVFAVQTKSDQYEQWRKFLIENKISEFINVFDPVHINNFKEKYDLTSTPLIYVLDKDKKIIAKKIAAEYVADMLKALEKSKK
jgi:thiol-disulfide isomerase/thioredoxin